MYLQTGWEWVCCSSECPHYKENIMFLLQKNLQIFSIKIYRGFRLHIAPTRLRFVDGVCLTSATVLFAPASTSYVTRRFVCFAVTSELVTAVTSTSLLNACVAVVTHGACVHTVFSWFTSWRIPLEEGEITLGERLVITSQIKVICKWLQIINHWWKIN